MLAHGVEGEGVDIDIAIHALEKATCGTHFLDDKMADAENHLAVIRRQHTLLWRVAQLHGDEKERGTHREYC